MSSCIELSIQVATTIAFVPLSHNFEDLTVHGSSWCWQGLISIASTCLVKPLALNELLSLSWKPMLLHVFDQA